LSARQKQAVQGKERSKVGKYRQQGFKALNRFKMENWKNKRQIFI